MSPSSTTPGRIQELIAALASEDDTERREGREALVEIGSAAVSPLVQVIDDERHAVRWGATKALAEIADPAATLAFLAALKDEDRDIRWLAGEGLIHLRKDAVAPLLEHLEQHSDSVWVRDGAHHVLAELFNQGVAPTVKPVIDALDGVAPEVETPLVARKVRKTL